MLRILGRPPSTKELADALEVAADVLELDVVYAYDGRYHFSIGSGWSIALSSDSEDRLRVERCDCGSPDAAMWVKADRHDRLSFVVSTMLNDVLELV